jgi:hypothetical protein
MKKNKRKAFFVIFFATILRFTLETTMFTKYSQQTACFPAVFQKCAGGIYALGAVLQQPLIMVLCRL